MLLKLKTYLAYFLILVFAWAIIPTHTIHALFADHEDTADDFCLRHHAHLGTHVEKKHTHCELLKLNSPVYSLPEFALPQAAVNEVNTILFFDAPGTVIPKIQYNLPSRAPPVS